MTLLIELLGADQKQVIGHDVLGKASTTIGVVSEIQQHGVFKKGMEWDS